MSSQQNYFTNLFDSSKYSAGNTVVSNGRARIEKTDDGRIYVVIDGVRCSANKYDLFGMNDNPTLWLETFVKEYDKETKKEEFNSPYEQEIAIIETKMDENTKNAKKSRTMQEKIKKAIQNANLMLHSFLAQCGVHLRSSLSGATRQHADDLYNEYWAQRFALTSENNNEMRYLSSNCSLVDDKNKAKQQMLFNDVTLERTYGG